MCATSLFVFYSYFVGLSISDMCCLTAITGANICITPSITEADLAVEFLEVAYLAASMPIYVFSRVTNWITAVITLERCLCIMAPLKVGSLLLKVLLFSICTTNNILEFMTTLKYDKSTLDLRSLFFRKQEVFLI